jgi:hypothetical protein
MFETGELVLFATLVSMMDMEASLHVVLAHAYSYISSAPILALYATKAAVTAKCIVGLILLMTFALIKFHTFKKPLSARIDRIIRAAMYAYIAFTYATNIVLIFTLESLGVPPIINLIPQ